MARQPVHILHGEIHARFARDGQQMQHGIGRTAHGNVQRHGVLESLESGDAARQDCGIVLLVIATAQFDDGAPGAQKQLLALGMGRHQRTVAGQRQAHRLGQAIHRISGKHAGT